MGQSRSIERLAIPVPPPSDEALVAWLRSFALEHPRWGYKRAHSEANKQGWSADIRPFHRLWRNAGLKVPYRKRKKPTHDKGIAMGVMGRAFILPIFAKADVNLSIRQAFGQTN